ncbi:MAG: hypothetical protein Q9167_003779 [Letrouitia subvulpina]
MSYNNRFGYSPYFHQSSGQDARGQESYQNSETGTSQYQNQDYQSLSYQSNQHQTPYRPTVTSTDRSTSYITSRDGDLSTGGQAQGKKGNHDYSTSRPPVDTTALGNLAYASSLSHESRSPLTPSDNPSLQQIINFNRSRTNQTYSSHPTYDPGTVNGYQQQQPGSYRATSSSEDQTRARSNSQFHQTSNINSPNRIQSEKPQLSYQNTLDDRRSSQPYYFQAPRPSSGQSHYVSSSRPNNPASHSPLTQPYQPVNSINGNSNNSIQSMASQQHARPLQQPHTLNQNALQSNSQPRELNGWKHEIQPTTQPAALGRSSNSQSPQPSQREPQQGSTTDNQTPTTVDPSQVFNHYEYQRRQAAAAAAVAAKQTKEAKQATEARQTAEAAAALKYVSNASVQKNNAAEPSKEVEMAAEMRMMIEKMREYKSKDPSLFSQIWEQAQPPGSELPNPPPSAQNTTPTPKPSEPGQLPSSSPTLSQNIPTEKLSDLGKFPALRRPRGGLNPRVSKKAGSSVTGNKQQNSQSQNKSASSPPLNSNTVAQSPNIISNTNQRYTDNKSPNPETIYVSGVGPSVDNLIQPSPAPDPDVASTPSQLSRPVSTISPATIPGRTSWPEDRKWDLAIAARNTLECLPINHGKSITPEEIHSFLGQNPSYEGLCRQIESRGFVIDRGYLARALLKAVPNLNPQARAPVDGLKRAPTIDQSRSISMTQVTAPIKPLNVQWTDQKRKPSAQETRPALPPTKQEMARKRTIAEIVDLSQLSDDDILPPKFQKLPNERGTPGYPSPPPQKQDQIFSQVPFNPNLPTLAQPRYTPNALKSTSTSLPFTPQQLELLHLEDIVKPLNKRDILKRLKYNPKTIVMDVLVAAGRHPHMSPLNHHLEFLRKNFRHVTVTSDLTTFRWDLVDPGGPQVPPTPLPVHTAVEVDGNEADDEGMMEFSDSRDQTRLGVVNGVESAESNAVNPSVAGAWQPLKFVGSHRRKTLPPVLNSNTTPSDTRRRGRPPGAKNKYSRKSDSSVNTTIQVSVPSRPRVDTTPARPSGLRNMVTPLVPSDGIAVMVPSPSPSKPYQGSQQPARAAASTKRSSQPSAPIHRVYKCHWKDCPAELHNLETLRKHVRRHRDAFDDPPYPCLWEGCRAGRTMNGEEPRPLEFQTDASWNEHLNGQHIEHYAWLLGDGPHTPRSSDTEASDCLSDSKGRQMTPVVGGSGGSGDSPDPLPLLSKRRAYHKTHGHITEREKAEAFLAAIEARRRNFGPGMDKNGVGLVTKQKNALLSDEPSPLRKVGQGDLNDQKNV